MNIFKKVRLFFTYRNIINNIEKDLELTYNVRIDNIYRLYTVLNIPEQYFEEPYNFRSSDINTLANTFISEYRGQFSQYLASRGLLELFELYEVKKVDKYSYLIVYGFSLINTKKIITNFFFWFVLVLLTSSVSFLFYHLIKTLLQLF